MFSVSDEENPILQSNKIWKASVQHITEVASAERSSWAMHKGLKKEKENS